MVPVSKTIVVTSLQAVKVVNEHSYDSHHQYILVPTSQLLGANPVIHASVVKLNVTETPFSITFKQNYL